MTADLADLKTLYLHISYALLQCERYLPDEYDYILRLSIILIMIVYLMYRFISC